MLPSGGSRGLPASGAELLEQLDERADRNAGAALGRVAVRLALVEAWPGDVEVGPLDAVRDEVLEEQPRRQHPAVALADVGDVGDLGVERLAQLLGQRHRPGLLAGSCRGRDDLRPQVVVVAHDGVDVSAEGDELCTGERRDVDDVVGVLLARADHRVGQDQPAFGVGVEHLDRLAAAHGENVRRADGLPARHVLRHRRPPDDVDRRLEPGHGAQRGDDRSRSAHVGLHPLHAGRRFEGQPAGVEGDALADQVDGRRALAGGVADPHQPRRVRGAGADAEDSAVAALLQCLVVEHLDVEAERATGVDGRLREVGRPQVTRRRVDEVAAELHRLREDGGSVDRSFDLLVPGIRYDEHRALDRAARGLRARRGAVSGERVGAEVRTLGDRPQLLLTGIAVRVGQCCGDAGRPGERTDRRAQAAAERLRLEASALARRRAQPDRDDGGSADGSQRGELGDLTGATPGAERLEGGKEPLLERLVDLGGAGRQLESGGTLRDADHDRIGLDVGQRCLCQRDGGHDRRCYSVTSPVMAAALRRSPMHDRHLALGARMAEFGGWEMPIQYAGVVEEHLAVRGAVGVFDVSHLGNAEVRGPGAKEFVNSCLTNDLDRIGPGQAQYTLCGDEATGGVVDDLIIYYGSDDDLHLVPNAANTAEVLRRLRAAAPPGIEVVDQHEQFAIIAVQGPRSPDVLRDIGLDPALDYMSFALAERDGDRVIVCRTGYTGEHGYELVVPSRSAPALWDDIVAAVAQYDRRPGGLGARDDLPAHRGHHLPCQGGSLGDAAAPDM